MNWVPRCIGVLTLIGRHKENYLIIWQYQNNNFFLLVLEGFDGLEKGKLQKKTLFIFQSWTFDQSTFNFISISGIFSDSFCHECCTSIEHRSIQSPCFSSRVKLKDTFVVYWFTFMFITSYKTRRKVLWVAIVMLKLESWESTSVYCQSLLKVDFSWKLVSVESRS